MNAFHTIMVLLVAFLLVYLQSSIELFRQLAGAQLDLLPALVVYASLYAGWATLGLLAVLGGFWYDSLSANPLGVSTLPLFGIGFVILRSRDYVLRDLRYAQFCFGLAASALVPLLTLLLLYTLGAKPLIGWISLWQWLLMAVGGAVATPWLIQLFGWLTRTFGYAASQETSFRPDRQIKRGRS